MENTTNKITVIIPAYNHEKYILNCLESIHNQTYRNFQWIVVDDCSTDNTLKILQEKQKYYRYQLISHKKNSGISQTLTEVIRDYATGKYIALCASDDFWDNRKIERQLAFMESHPEFAMCYGRTYYVDISSKIIGTDDSRYYKGGFIFNEIITQRFHPPVNYMIKKEILEELGFYTKGVVAEDFYMNCMISYKYQIGYIPEFMGYYRVDPRHTNQMTYDVLMSHEYTINIFASDPIFKTAYKLHCLRCFSKLSAIKKYKFLSLKYLLRGRVFFSTDFVRGIYHLFFYWN